jgi:hypothetical protein
MQAWHLRSGADPSHQCLRQCVKEVLANTSWARASIHMTHASKGPHISPA